MPKYYYTFYSLSVLSLAKSLQLILEISTTYRLICCNIEIQWWMSLVDLFAICNLLWANRSCHWCKNEIKMPQKRSSKKVQFLGHCHHKLKKFANKEWAYMVVTISQKYFALFLKYSYRSYHHICFQWHKCRSTFRRKQNVHAVMAIWNR